MASAHLSLATKTKGGKWTVMKVYESVLRRYFHGKENCKRKTGKESLVGMPSTV